MQCTISFPSWILLQIFATLYPKDMIIIDIISDILYNNDVAYCH